MFIDTTAEGDATGEVAAYFASQRAAWGFLPNYVQCFATRPDVATAWARLNLAVRDGMERRRYEVATLAAAMARRSTYCATAHATFLRDVCGDPAVVEAIAAAPDGGALAEPDRTIFRFATKVALAAADVEQEDVDALRAVGLDDNDVIDVVMAVAARAFFTTVLDGLGARLDTQTAQQFEPEVRAAFTVGRPAADQ
ncbi:MAG: peroxidase-related enzyme [Dermatophilaceae bacterium]|jgi:uncharacterized peroxidase-related enzyme